MVPFGTEHQHQNWRPELVRTFVKNLRRKLGNDAASPTYILNERGVGYRMAKPGTRD